MRKFRQRRHFCRRKPPPSTHNANYLAATPTTDISQDQSVVAKTTNTTTIFLFLSIAIISINNCCLVQCQQQQQLSSQQSQSQASSNQLSAPQQFTSQQHQHYQGSSSISQQLQPTTAYNLVNPEPFPQAQNSPLIRRLQQTSLDASTNIDNVITSESTAAAAVTTNSRPSTSQQQQTSTQSCQLPPTWMGKWYQTNKEPIRVTSTEISDKGQCRDKKGDKYLFEYTKQQQPSCLICLVINERHLNVLQYKESSCQPIPQRYLNRTTNSLLLDLDHSLLDSICSDITGDAQLESLFRLDTPAIECPINGKYHFSYDNCREPLSSLDSCIDKKQLNFKFSACPDVPGSESKSEVLKCFADWSEGNNYYMIGRLEHASNHQDKGKFRCFVYERLPDGGIQMAQSLEESCYGLINPYEGPKTLRLTTKQSPLNHKCHFPAFIQSQSESWLSVDNSLIYMFNQNSTKYQVKETKEGNVIEEATCLQQFVPPPSSSTTNQVHHPHATSLHHNQHTAARSSQQQQQVVSTASSRRYPPSNNFNQVADQSQAHLRSIITDVVYLVQITKNCHTTDYCVRFYRRTSGIVQIDYFTVIAGVDGIQKCRNAFNGTPQTQIITSTNLENQRCPFEGAYTIEAPIESDFTYNPSNIFMCPRQSFLTAQCDHPSRLRIHYKCTPARYMIKNLYCLGSWSTNGLVRLLLADDERQRYSAWYRDYGTLQLDSTSDPTSNNNINSAQAQALQMQQSPLTRSQQLLGLSSTTSTVASVNNNQQYNSLAPIVDLQIALITPLPTKPMQVRLTRRNQCSDLRGYSNQGSLNGGSSSSSIPSYASSATAANAIPSSSASSIVMIPPYLCSLSNISILFVTISLILIGQRDGGGGLIISSV